MSHNADELSASLKQLNAASFSSESERVNAKNAALELVARLETPWETTLDCVWSRPALSAALTIGVDVGLFKKWVSSGGGAKTASELGKMTGVDSILLSRFLRHMGAMYALKEVGQDTYEMTPFTKSLADIGHSNCFSGYWTDVNGPGFLTLPAFLAETKYANPQDLSHSNWQKAKKSDLNLFQWLGENPKSGQDFQHVMGAYSASKSDLSGLYPTENLLKGWNKQTMLLVDMGGSKGHDIEKFRAQHPDLPAGSLVLQDLAGPIGEAEVQKPVEAQVHDFFQPQPVKGARVYYMHIVLHDWPDAKATEILKNIAAVMTPGYSKVLLHESVIVAHNPHPQTTASDLTMMMALSAMERTEGMWKELLASAGLRTVKIWGKPGAVESVVEAELA